MRWNKYLICLGLVTFGILLGVFFCNFSYFQFDKAIKISDLFSLTITSIVGIYIATSVSKAFTKNNSEKEFLINEVKSTLKIVNDLIAAIHEKVLPFGPTVNRFKTINEDLLLIERLIDSSHCKGLVVKPARTELIGLRNKITKISPTNNNIILDNSNYNLARAQILKLKSLLFNLVFEINKQ